MDFINSILDYFVTVPVHMAFFWLLIQNILQLVLCLLGGWLLTKAFYFRRIYDLPEPLSKQEVALATLCVFCNSLVALAGWCLWRQGIITINRAVDFNVIFDIFALVLMMDFFMYVTHRIVHIPGIYEWVHKTHHKYEITRTLSLFVLNPLEVAGFGFLWLLVLSIYSSSWLGIVIYLLLNAAFGAIGHIGVEPFPKNWLKVPVLNRFTTSTFHAQHHKEVESNFGFYTDIWDRLFGSLNKNYQIVYERAVAKVEQ